jgi:DnaJ-domain-containing protein 1
MSAEQRPVLVLSIVCTLMAPLAVFARGTGPQIDTPDSQVPTAIERALIERTCGATDTSSAEIDAYQQCFSPRLLSLRADFGRDLGRLSGSDRTRIDAACNHLHTAEQREAYLDCLGDQLVALRNRQKRGNPTVSEDAAVAPSALLAPSVAPVPPARLVSSWPSATVIGGTVGSVLAAAGVVLRAVRSRRTRRRCRVCGVDVPDSDLCPTCRHEAAEALRRAAAERAHKQRAQQEEERRQREHEAEQREQRARADEEARMREQELARQRQTDEDVHGQSHAAAVPIVPAVEEEEDEVFDPYVVLGVPCEAGQDDIRTAYQQAKTKYDPDLVSCLGDEAQAHFKAKAQSVERAYQMLSDVRP